MLAPVDKLFTDDRVCRFPALKSWDVFLPPKCCAACRAEDRTLPERQTLNGTYINQVEVAIDGLTWRQDVGPAWSQDYVPQTCGTHWLNLLGSYESWETSMILSASFARSLMSVLSDRAKICRTSGGSCARKNALTNVAGSAVRLQMC